MFVGGKIPILNYIGEQYALALESLGHTVFRFNKSDFAESYKKLIAFQQGGLDAAIVRPDDICQNRPRFRLQGHDPMYHGNTLDGLR